MKINTILFMGTPQFAVPSLEALVESGYKPVLVISQPDKPKGRKRKLQSPEVKIKALELGLSVIQPIDVNSSETLEQLRDIEPDLIVTVAYGGYLKKTIRKMPKYGCINLHPSLLPQYRGSSPLNYSLFNGDDKTGVTIFKIVAKMDAGPILYQKQYDIDPDENYTKLYDRLSKEGAKDLIKSIQLMEEKSIQLVKQDDSLATFSFKIEKDDTYIDWSNSALNICNMVRGLSEKPGAVTYFRDKAIKIIKATPWDDIDKHEPGTIVDIPKNQGILVSTGAGNLMIDEVQPAGKKVMSAAAYNLGARIKVGEKFSSGNRS